METQSLRQVPDLAGAAGRPPVRWSRVAVVTTLGLIAGAAIGGLLWTHGGGSVVGAMAGALAGIPLGLLLWPLGCLRRKPLPLAGVVLVGVFAGAVIGWWHFVEFVAELSLPDGPVAGAVVGAAYLAAVTSTAAFRRQEWKMVPSIALGGTLLGVLLVGGFGLLIAVGGLFEGVPAWRALMLLFDYVRVGAACGAVWGGLVGAALLLETKK